MRLTLVLKGYHPSVIANKHEFEGDKVVLYTEKENPIVRVQRDSEIVFGFHIDQLLYFIFE